MTVSRCMALVVALAITPAVYGQESPTERLQAHILSCSRSRDPNISFIVGLQSWPDFELDQIEIRTALLRSGLQAGTPEGPLYGFLTAALSISKQGRRVKFELAREIVFDLDGGQVKFKKHIEFDLTRGRIEDMSSRSRRERMAAASPGGYVWINEVKNIQVSEGGKFYNLYDLYCVREHSGTVVAWIKAGKVGWGVGSRWARIPFEDDVESADAEGFEAMESLLRDPAGEDPFEATVADPDGATARFNVNPDDIREPHGVDSEGQLRLSGQAVRDDSHVEEAGIVKEGGTTALRKPGGGAIGALEKPGGDAKEKATPPERVATKPDGPTEPDEPNEPVVRPARRIIIDHPLGLD